MSTRFCTPRRYADGCHSRRCYAARRDNGRSTIVSAGALVSIQASSFAVNPVAGATIRSKRSTSHSRRSAWVSDRPFSIRASTGHARAQRRVLDRLEQRHRDGDLLLLGRVLRYCSGTTRRYAATSVASSARAIRIAASSTVGSSAPENGTRMRRALPAYAQPAAPCRRRARP